MRNDDWVKIADYIHDINFNEHNLAQVTVNGTSVCIAKVNDELKACAAKCPHASGVMAQGYINALGHIVCPLHRYCFNLVTGHNVSGEGYHLSTYEVLTNEDGIFIKKSKRKGFLSVMN